VIESHLREREREREREGGDYVCAFVCLVSFMRLTITRLLTRSHHISIGNLRSCKDEGHRPCCGGLEWLSGYFLKVFFLFYLFSNPFNPIFLVEPMDARALLIMDVFAPMRRLSLCFPFSFLFSRLFLHK